MLLRLRRWNWKLLLLFILSLLIFVYWDIWWRYTWDIDSGTLRQDPTLFIPSNQKIVLLWTTMFYEKPMSAWGNLKQVMEQCPHKCHFTVDKSFFPISDALVYHGFPEGQTLMYLGKSMYPLPKPAKRRPEQVWVYLMMEPPGPHYQTYDTMQDYHDFNWTMTYRRDSDIRILYGDFERIPTEHLGPNNSTNRSLIAGMISECGRESGRDTYISELKNYIPVDIYGKCGTHVCKKAWNCYKILSNKYKFWLSFENSLCADYLTEKFFRPLEYGMVPVYYGHPDSLQYAPVGSYIHTKDFKNPEALAKYLTYLDRNPAEYLKYFEWKKEFRLKANTSSLAWCTLCTKLHNLPNEQPKSYRSIPGWFLRNNTLTSVCLKPSFRF